MKTSYAYFDWKYSPPHQKAWLMNLHKRSHNSTHSPRRQGRRDFLQAGLYAAGLSLGFSGSRPTFAQATGVQASQRHLDITSIERTTVRMEYREIPARNLARELPHWVYSEIVTVTLKSGHVGYGETLLFYTWRATSDEDVQHALGKNAVELMWHDSRLGAGLQMALFDAVARAAEVPIHVLLGPKLHDKTPLSWWNIDTSAADMAAECLEAARQGYVAYKTKGRPWFDLFAQVDAVAHALPESFKLDMDYNDTLLTAEKAIPILKKLDSVPQVGIHETPIPQGDVPGNKAICEAIRVPIAMHYGNPEPWVALSQNVCDGFVVGGGATTLLKAGHAAELAGRPFWLQLVGTGITAAYSLHFGAALSQATWPAVNCHQLFSDTLLTQPIMVKDGFASVPDRPGLGFDIDWDIVERRRVAKPAQRPDPPRLIETRWPSGKVMYTANNGKVNFMLTAGQQGKYPFYEPGADTRLIPDDGTHKWRETWEKARIQPFSA